MGQDLSLPVLISPTGVQAVHPDGELAVARAAAARGHRARALPARSRPIEDVVEANPQTFAQLYWAGSRDAIEARVARARAAGAAGIIVTLDWTWSHARDWGSPFIPAKIWDWQTIRKLGPEVLARPKWAYRFARAGGPPVLAVPNWSVAGPGFFEAYGEWMQTPPPSWEDLAWLRSLWDGPFMVKGITRVDDARRAVEVVGASALSVSNHGGNNLDGTPATIRALPAVVEAVGGEIEILLDGGIRRGSDVVKALALGARAVMIGRAYLFALAADGQAGVENVLDLLRMGIDSALLGLGKASVGDLTPDDLLIPDGFERRLGADGPRRARDRRRRGIGAATVQLLAQRGWAVVAVDRDGDDPRLPYAMGRWTRRPACSHVADVTDLEALARRRTRRGPLRRPRRDDRRRGRDRRRRAAVGGAARAGGGGPRRRSPRRAERRPRRDTRAAAPPGAARRPLHRGRLHGLHPRPADARRLLRGQGGRRGLVRALAAELGGTGVTANAVSPGSTRTPILEESARLYGLGGEASPPSSRSAACSSPRRSRR